MLAILSPARRQVNAKGLLREVQAAEEGLEAGVGGPKHTKEIIGTAKTSRDFPRSRPMAM